MERQELFSVDGIVAVITGGGTGRPILTRHHFSGDSPLARNRAHDGKGFGSERSCQGVYHRTPRGCTPRSR